MNAPLSKKKLELTRVKIAALAAGVLVLIAAAVGATVLIEHKVHARHEEAGHEEHEGHGHGEAKRGDHGHGEHEEGEHADGKIKLTPAMRENAGLEILKAGPGKVAVTVALPGEVALNAEAVAHVTPRVAGAAREVKRQLGDVVKKGEVLAILDSRELAEMQRELLAAKERLSLAQTNFKRQEALWKEKISSEKDYHAAKQALAEAQIEHRGATQKLSLSAGSNARGGGYSLVAPLDGTIIEKHIAIGEVLKDDTQAFVIADLSSVWVNVTVYAKDLPRIQMGQAAEVRAEGIEKPALGTITYLGSVVGEQNRSAVARVVLKEPGAAWRPGLFVTAEIIVAEGDAPVAITEEAVQKVEGKDVVFVQEGDVFEMRPVKLGRHGAAPEGQSFHLVEVTAGVAAGELYVAKNSFILKAELGKSEASHEH
jgi:membrane fusion protein, heavy metal efflux system